MPVMYITINTSVHVDLLNPSNKNNNKCFLLIDYFYIRRNDAYMLPNTTTYSDSAAQTVFTGNYAKKTKDKFVE